MAERVAVPAGNLIPLPHDADPLRVAALVNPAASAWLALRHRACLRTGETVLVLGATGCAGRSAVRLAHEEGAAHIVAAGRKQSSLGELTALGASRTVCLDAPEESVRSQLAETVADVDVVVDYLWGHPAELALHAIAETRPRAGRRRTRWVQVGDAAGADMRLPAAVLRRVDVELSGCGMGSVPVPELRRAAEEVITAYSGGRLDIDVRPVPLSQVADAWAVDGSGARVVLVP